MSALPSPVAISGASGLVGSALSTELDRRGVKVLRLVRRTPRGQDEIAWSPAERILDAKRLGNAEAVVHLAGESLAGFPWTEARKRRILGSRTTGTRLVAEAIAASGGPRVLVSASAVGYYGDRGEATLTERSAPGEGFLPSVAVAWERATAPATAAGVRVILLRTGPVLSPDGGLVGRLLLPFRLGLGARLGSGRQWISWISLRDLVGVILEALGDERYAGPFNAVAPNPVRNAEFTRQLGRALGRPAVFALPAWLLRLVFGQMAREALLSSTRVLPEGLEQVGFRFQDPDLGAALQTMLGD